MKILLVGYHNPKFITITEYIEEALVHLGYELNVFDDRKFILPSQIRAYFKVLEAWDLRWINQHLISLAKKNKPEICLVTGGHRILPETVKKLKSLGIKTVLWTIDAPTNFEPIFKVAPYYDLIFCGGSEAVELLTCKGFKNVLWLPFACDPVHHKPADQDSHTQARHAYDVVFVGSYYPNRLEVLRELADLDLAVFGPGWEKIPIDDPLRKCIQGGQLTPQQWTEIFSTAKIILVIHYQDGKAPCYQASPKLYEALACRGFVLCDNQKDVKELFQDCKHLGIFNDIKDLKMKISHYISDPQARQTIARQGYEEVKAKHTYENRLIQLMSVVTKNL